MNYNEVQHIFRAYDIRGIFNDDLDTEIMNRIGRAFATYAKNHGVSTITVGGDIRASTPALLHAFLAGAMSSGVSCKVVQKSPLGVTLYVSQRDAIGLSAFITASHLPPEWNGIKFYHGEGHGFSVEENKAVQAIFNSGEFSRPDAFSVGSLTYENPYHDYISYLQEKFTFNKSFKVLLDCGNGAMSLVAKEVFKALGFSVDTLYCEPDPRFPNRSSEPNPTSLSTLADKVKNGDYAFGVGFDGDGDRAVIVDDEGHVLSGDETGIIIGKYFLENNPGATILMNVEGSLVAEQELTKAGGNVKWIPVGHSYLAIEAEKHNAIWGFEASGHMLAPSIFKFDDAIVIPLLMAQVLENTPTKLSTLRKEIPRIFKERINMKSTEDKKFKIIEKIIEHYKTIYDEVITLDGALVKTESYRVLIRASNTSPKIRATIEAKDEETLKKIVKETHDLLEQYVNQ